MIWRELDELTLWGPEPSPEEAKELAEAHGVSLFISLNDEPPDYEDAVKELGAEVLHHPVPNLGFIPIEEAHPGIIRRLLAERRKRYIHCLAGIGRSGTLACMYLIAKGATVEEAVARVRRLQPLWPESPIQRIVPRWYGRLLAEIGEETLSLAVSIGARYDYGAGLEHASTVAHVALDLLEAVERLLDVNLGVEAKRMLYLAGLLHDIGRAVASDAEHHEAGARIIESESRIPAERRGLLAFLVRNHRTASEPEKDPFVSRLPTPEAAILLAGILKVADAFADAYKPPGFEYRGVEVEGREIIIRAIPWLRDKILAKARTLEKLGIKLKVP